MKTLIDALTTQLAPDVHLGRATHSVERTANGRWLVHTDGATCSADAVVLACPAFAQGDILSELDGELAQEVGAIPYTCAVVASVGFHRADLPANPEGFGYLTPQRLGRPVLGVLWSSCIFPRQAPDNRFQFRAIMGGWRRRDVLEWDDGKIVQTVLDDLRETLKIQAAPEFTWVYRWEKAIPQYHLGHLERLRRIEDARRRHPGLWLTGNPYRGVSLNDCTHEAEFVSEQVKSYLFKERG
jgi:oxygen-dependent protoporphyrinogen oxidase